MKTVVLREAVLVYSLGKCSNCQLYYTLTYSREPTPCNTGFATPIYFFFPSTLLFWENLKSTAEESCQQQEHCISSGYLQPGSQYVTLTQSDLARKERGYLRSKRESKQGENTFSLVSCQILLSVSLEKWQNSESWSLDRATVLSEIDYLLKMLSFFSMVTN